MRSSRLVHIMLGDGPSYFFLCLSRESRTRKTHAKVYMQETQVLYSDGFILYYEI